MRSIFLVAYDFLFTQMHEFEIPKHKAEKILVEHEGDIGRALRTLIKPHFSPT